MPAIVLVAVGSSDPVAQATYDGLEAAVRERFPRHEVRRVFTSQKALAGGPTLTGALTDLIALGVREVVLQSLHIVPGVELRELQSLQVPGLRIAVGQPLLAEGHDIAQVAALLRGQCVDECPNIIAAHGSNRTPEIKALLDDLARRLQGRAVLCSISGLPGPGPLELVAEAARAAGRVHVIPLMLVAGRHIRRDVMGDGSGAWKHILGVETMTLAPALGELPEVRAIFVRHLEAALASLQEKHG